MAKFEDQGPWFVRVADSKVSVGIFACTELQLPDLIDEVCEADACEYRRLPAGGFVFGGEVVLHSLDDDDDSEHTTDGWLTDDWGAVYDEDGEWERIDAGLVDT